VGDLVVRVRSEACHATPLSLLNARAGSGDARIVTLGPAGGDGPRGNSKPGIGSGLADGRAAEPSAILAVALLTQPSPRPVWRLVVLLVVVAAQRQPRLGAWRRQRHRPAVGLPDVLGALPIGTPTVAKSSSGSRSRSWPAGHDPARLAWRRAPGGRRPAPVASGAAPRPGRAARRVAAACRRRATGRSAPPSARQAPVAAGGWAPR
jgi:hypothetical protein